MKKLLVSIVAVLLAAPSFAQFSSGGFALDKESVYYGVRLGITSATLTGDDIDDKDKPQFAQLPKELSIESITLDEALELFKLPRTLGEYEGMSVVIGSGRFGPYVLHNKKYSSLPDGEDPMTITLEKAIELIEEKRNQETKKHLKIFTEDLNLEILNGRYGPYLAYDGKNYRLPKSMHEKAADLTYEECMKIINSTPVKKGA